MSISTLALKLEKLTTPETLKQILADHQNIEKTQHQALANLVTVGTDNKTLKQETLEAVFSVSHTITSPLIKNILGEDTTLIIRRNDLFDLEYANNKLRSNLKFADGAIDSFCFKLIHEGTDTDFLYADDFFDNDSEVSEHLESIISQEEQKTKIKKGKLFNYFLQEDQKKINQWLKHKGVAPLDPFK